MTARNSNSLRVFNRSAGGDLTAAGCFVAGATAGCETVATLTTPQSIAVSPDCIVYVVSSATSTVTDFIRGAGGVLTTSGCVKDVSSAATCASTNDGLTGATGLAAT